MKVMHCLLAVVLLAWGGTAQVFGQAAQATQASAVEAGGQPDLAAIRKQIADVQSALESQLKDIQRSLDSISKFLGDRQSSSMDTVDRQLRDLTRDVEDIKRDVERLK